MLCHLCRQIFRSTPKLSTWKLYNPVVYPHHPDVQALQDSVSRNCHLCTMLHDALYRDSLAKPAEKLSLEYEIHNDDPEEFDIVFGYRRDSQETRGLIMFYLLPCIDGCADSDNVTGDHEAHLNTGSNANKILALRWYRQCLATHHECSQSTSTTWRPTRLLDIGPADSMSDLQLKISGESSLLEPYMTLSHCWGLVQPRTLTRATLDDLKHGISLATLPKTFQHAIAVAKWFGVRYLWIDSLCIIQDSLEDWQRESFMMRDVYKNSACNIAATAASDGRQGCFFDRNPLVVQPCRVHVEWEGLLQGTFYCVDRHLWQDCIESAPLISRAWVVQERFLAPRVLHFGKNQLFWECHERLACETFTNEVPTPPADLASTYTTRNFKSLGIASRWQHPDAILDKEHPWYKVVVAYSKGALTKGGDKLIALSGIAKEMQSRLNDRYLAGMWKTHLEAQLLWSRPGEHELRRPPTYRAPSWSWLSVDGRVVTPALPLKEVFVRVVDADVELASRDETGPLKGGFVTLAGQLKPASWKTLNGPTVLDLDGSLIGAAFTFDVEPTSTASPDDIFCLPVATSYWGHGWDQLEGLILTRQRGMTFQRLGIFRAVGDAAGDLFASNGFKKIPECTITII